MVEKKLVKSLTNPLEHHPQKPLLRQTLDFLTSLNSMDEPAFISTSCIIYNRCITNTIVPCTINPQSEFPGLVVSSELF